MDGRGGIFTDPTISVSSSELRKLSLMALRVPLGRWMGTMYDMMGREWSSLCFKLRQLHSTSLKELSALITGTLDSSRQSVEEDAQYKWRKDGGKSSR
jgi:hypothetical protein